MGTDATLAMHLAGAPDVLEQLMSVRLAVAKQEGLDEPTIEKVKAYEASDLTERHKVALRFADAIMTQPGQISDELRSDLFVHFTREQIVEMTVDVMKWNYQKIPVSLRNDFEVKEGELVPLVFDENGHWVKPS
ncbi:MAG: hypothetical protein EBV24_05600 [Actinobacteria bacterium]|nr:hypothetical protein [Actinomycetota bacterium]